MALKKVGILTGGGDCSGLNAVIRAVARTAIIKHSAGVLGIEGAGVETALPDPATAFLRAIDVLGIAKMHRLEYGGKRSGLGWHDDQVDVIGHQAVGEDVESALGRVIPKQTQVPAIVRPDEEDVLATVAYLRNVVRDTGNHNSRNTWHG